MIQCPRCKTAVEPKADKRGTPRMPRGWKKLAEEWLCPKCWASAYVMRAVVFPLAGPLKKEDWPDLREALGRCWSASTQLANFCVTELAKADVTRGPDLLRLPKMPSVNLYQLGIKRVPEMDKSSVVAIINTVQRKYGSQRLDVIWRGAASWPDFRYPVPYPVPRPAWKARWLSEDEHVPIISATLGKHRFDLRLRGGAEFRPQLAAFRQLLAGDAIPAELSIYRRRVTESDHRPGLVDRKPAGGRNVSYRVMIKLAMWVPRSGPKTGKSMLVSTSALEFWAAITEGAQPWILNADHVRRWVLSHSNRLQRLSTDTKFEKRWPARQRMHINEYREMLCRKQKDRLKTFCHTAAKMLVSFALRQGVASIEYDDTVKDYLPSFPWFDLKTLLEQKCKAANIQFTCASADVTTETPSPLAGTEEVET